MKAAISTALCAALLTTQAQAGDVIVVGENPAPGVDFTDVQDAIDFALDDDLILIREGTYSRPGALIYEIDGKALTLVAESGATVVLSEPMNVRNLSAGQSVVLRGLAIESSDEGNALTVIDNAGAVWIEDATLLAQSTLFPFLPAGAGLSAIDSDEVVVHRSSLEGSTLNTGFGKGFPGLSASHSQVALYDCSLQGGKGADGSIGNEGGPAASLIGGELFAAGTTFAGGDGGRGGDADVFIPCTDGARGGSGLHLFGSSPSANVLECSLSGGSGGPPGAGGTCGFGPAGSASQIDSGSYAILPGNARSFTGTTPVREGQVASLVYEGQPGDFVLLNFSLESGYAFNAAFNGVFLLGSPSYTVIQGSIPAGGTKEVPVTINELGAGTEGVRVFLQPVFASVADGLTFAAPSSLVLLDSSL